MWKLVAVGVSMVVCGVMTFYATMFILVEFGLRYHDNKDYYLHDPVLPAVLTAIGLLVPVPVAWYLNRRAKSKVECSGLSATTSSSKTEH